METSSTTPDNLDVVTAALLSRQSLLVSALRPILPEHALLWEPEDTIPYECDGLAAYRRMPLAVALPETEKQVAQILKTCFEMQVPIVPRGSGTGLSGGAGSQSRWHHFGRTERCYCSRQARCCGSR